MPTLDDDMKPVKPSRWLAESLDKMAAKARKGVAREGPLWQGPESPDKQGGISFSLLSRFLACRERFRLYALEGWRGEDRWNHRTGYGDMWHVCEQSLAANDPSDSERASREGNWSDHLFQHTRKSLAKYPMQRAEIEKWYNVCKAQFPLYAKHWENHPDVTGRTNLFAEGVFNVPYRLPSGRLVYLKGKWDSVDLVTEPCGMCKGAKGVSSSHTLRYHKCAACGGAGKRTGVWLQENKTKGDVLPAALSRQLTFDLQTMIYLAALGEEQKKLDDSTIKARLSYHEGKYRHFYSILGVRYNVVRRPLSSGKGNIKQHKAKGKKPAETKAEFYERLGKIIESAEGPEWGCQPGEHHFFKRWRVIVTDADVAKFKRECLDPILENLCDWYFVMERRQTDPFEPMDNTAIHWRHPFGVFNPLDEGGHSDMDEMLMTGSDAGLARTDDLFPELAQGG